VFWHRLPCAGHPQSHAVSGLSRLAHNRQRTALWLAAFGLLTYAVWDINDAATDDLAVLPYPDGKIYALSIEDDADGGDVAHLAPVYTFLKSIRLPVTKSVWMFTSAGNTSWNEKRFTLQSREYADFVEQLRSDGNEIALHGVSPGNDDREAALRGLDRFKAVFGEYPSMNFDHSKNRENIYFGRNRDDSALFKWLYDFFDSTHYAGEDEKSPYFWGDLARERIKYHRGFYVLQLNTLAANPSMPYFNPSKPYVRYWHTVTDGFNYRRFIEVLDKNNLVKLKRQYGASILQTHFAFGFLDARHRLKTGFVSIMRHISQDRELWVSPASVLLDRLQTFKKIRAVSGSGTCTIHNGNSYPVTDITLAGGTGIKSVHCLSGCHIRKDRQGVLILDRIDAGTAAVINAPCRPKALTGDTIGGYEYYRLMGKWLWRSVSSRLFH